MNDMNNTTNTTTFSHREVLDILGGHGLRRFNASDRLRRIEIDGYAAVIDWIDGTYNVLNADGRIVFADNGDDNDAMAYLANLVY